MLEIWFPPCLCDLMTHLLIHIVDELDICRFVASRWCYLSQPHFEASVRMRLTLPKSGIESPPGLLQLWSSTAEGKTPCLEVFFIPLERS
jgi:hypothetical protein